MKIHFPQLFSLLHYLTAEGIAARESDANLTGRNKEGIFHLPYECYPMSENFPLTLKVVQSQHSVSGRTFTIFILIAILQHFFM